MNAIQNRPCEDSASAPPKEIAPSADMKRVVFVLHDGFALNSLSNMTDILFVACWLSARKLYDVTFATGPGSAAAYNGVRIEGAAIAELAPTAWDYVVVVTSFDPQALAGDAALRAFLRGARRGGATVIGVETGGIALAAAGLLDGGQAAVHWANREGFQEAYPEIGLSSDDIAFYDRSITCVGGTATFDLALYMVETDFGATLALEVAEHLCDAGRYLERRGRFRASAGFIHGDRTLDVAVRAMNDHIEEPVDCKAIADIAGVSPRRLGRIFRRRLGLTPKAHYLALRLTRAQNLLQQTRLTVREVAAATGFTHLAHFSRAYKARFGLSPRADRVQTQTASVPRLFVDQSLIDTTHR